MATNLRPDPFLILPDGGAGQARQPDYIWPFPTKDLQSQSHRIDDGWDLQQTPPGDVLCVRSGTVSWSHDPGGFGPNYAVVALDPPVPPQGDSIYYGHCDPAVPVGTHLNQGDKVADQRGGPRGNATVPGWLEIGFWRNGPTKNGNDMHAALVDAPTASGTGGGAPVGGTDGGNASQGSGNTQFGKPDPKDIKADNLQVQDLPDVRDNRPFHFFFSSTAKMIRGGMFEMAANMSKTGDYGAGAQPQNRPGGQFACFFMMNPNSITTNSTFDTNVASPLTVDPAALASMPYFIQQQTISFTIIFNRQYDVWQGGVVNPKTGKPPGPSDIGVRWDIRALERLLGVYDATNDVSLGVRATIGVGAQGPGSRPPTPVPLQVVFGGPNSYQFQGSIASFAYTYTLFDVNMIPVEATADIALMRVYYPALSNADVVNNWTGLTGQLTGYGGFQVGGGGMPVHIPPSQTSFNAEQGIQRVFGGFGP